MNEEARTRLAVSGSPAQSESAKEPDRSADTDRVGWMGMAAMTCTVVYTRGRPRRNSPRKLPFPAPHRAAVAGDAKVASSDDDGSPTKRRWCHLTLPAAERKDFSLTLSLADAGCRIWVALEIMSQASFSDNRQSLMESSIFCRNRSAPASTCPEYLSYAHLAHYVFSLFPRKKLLNDSVKKMPSFVRHSPRRPCGDRESRPGPPSATTRKRLTTLRHGLAGLSRDHGRSAIVPNGTLFLVFGPHPPELLSSARHYGYVHVRCN
ncbi:hypothetical protein BR93DRAFT_144032 [Coniochaeta sp. PMI_546]|nr:hypothetical protein BR93DRAFT_144032 [Coniochaeta sp. PMI_546]